ncbi:MAG TPA: hypothetical protein VGS22_02865 [Thermoanaerobaculia bacterium]|nr:hypothetical protein [Thermoanaerobaculia bacterium]
MALRKSKEEAGTLNRPKGDALPAQVLAEAGPRIKFKHKYTTGPFLLPQDSGSLDWALLNNDTTQQTARVTVFKCPVGALKVAMPPGPLVVSLQPGESTHNANTYPEGFAYEVQVECNSKLLFPYVSVWPANFGVVIPGTGINSGTFLAQML